MEKIIDRQAKDTQFADELMDSLRILEKSVKAKKSCQLEAVQAYLARIREVTASELLLGVKPEDFSAKGVPDLEGLFRFGVTENHTRLVEACLELGADPRDDNYWGLIYPLALDFPEIVNLVASTMVEDLPALTNRWAKSVLDGEDDAAHMLGLLIQIRDLYCRGNILREAETENFGNWPQVSTSEQLELFA